MNEIIPLGTKTLGSEAVSTVNARILHDFLGSSKDFTNWIKGRIASYGFIEGQDFCIADADEYAGSGGHNKTEYHVTIDMAKQLSMVERTKKGREARLYFIECERRVHDPEAMAIAYIEGLKIQAQTGIAARMKLEALGLMGEQAARARIAKRQPINRIYPEDRIRPKLFPPAQIIKGKAPSNNEWTPLKELSSIFFNGERDIWVALFNFGHVDSNGWPLAETDWMNVFDYQLYVRPIQLIREIKVVEAEPIYMPHL